MITKISQYDKVKNTDQALQWFRLLVNNLTVHSHLSVFALGDTFVEVQSVLKNINLKHTNDRIGNEPILAFGRDVRDEVIGMLEHTTMYAGIGSGQQKKFKTLCHKSLDSITYDDRLYIWWFRALRTIRVANAGDMIEYLGKIMSILYKKQAEEKRKEE